MNPILDRLETASAGVVKSATEYKEQTELNQKATQTANDKIINAVESAVENKSIIEVQKNTAELKAQQQIRKSLSDSAIIATQQALLSKSAKQAQLVDERQVAFDESMNKKITGIGILDGVINSFRSIDEEIALDTATSRQRALHESITGLTQQSESLERAINQTQEIMTDATVLAAERLLKSNADQQVAEAEKYAAESNAQAIEAVFNADKTALAAINAEVAAKNNVEELEHKRLTREHRVKQMNHDIKVWADQAEQRETQLTIQQDKVRKIQDPKQRALEQANLDANINMLARNEKAYIEQVSVIQEGAARFGSSLGITPEYVTHVNTRGSAAQKQQLNAFMQAGMSADNSFGDTTAEAYTNYVVAGGKKSSRASNMIRDLGPKIREAHGGKSVDKVTGASTLNSLAESKAKEMLANIKFGDATNVYQAAPLETLMNNSVAIQESAFYQKVLKDSKIRETDPNALIDLAVNAIADKDVKLSMNEAVEGIKTIFDVAVAYNRESPDVGLSQFNLPIQENYKTRINFSGSSDPLAAPIHLAEELASDIGEFFGGDPKFDSKVEQLPTFFRSSMTLDVTDATILKLIMVRKQRELMPAAATVLIGE